MFGRLTTHSQCLDIGALQGFNMVRRAVPKAHRAPGKGWVSAIRREQLRADRLQTKAISKFLQAEREKLLEHLTPSCLKDRFTKRNELMRVARQTFKALPSHEQEKYMHLATQETAMASTAPPPPAPSPQPAEGSGSLSSHPGMGADQSESLAHLHGNIAADNATQEAGVETQEAGLEDALAEMLGLDVPFPPQARASQGSTHRSTRVRITTKRPDIGVYGPGQPASPPAECRWTPLPKRSQVWEYGSLGVGLCRTNQGTGSPREAQASPVKQNAPDKSVLRDRLMEVAPQPLRELYGDAGCMEVLAATLRILDVADESLMCLSGAVAVKLAAVLGVAAKLSQSSDDHRHIVKLWAKIAGKPAERQIRDMETKVISMWVKPCLGSDSFLHKMK